MSKKIKDYKVIMGYLGTGLINFEKDVLEHLKKGYVLHGEHKTIVDVVNMDSIYITQALVLYEVEIPTPRIPEEFF